jgi:hypothetical protein
LVCRNGFRDDICHGLRHVGGALYDADFVRLRGREVGAGDVGRIESSSFRMTEARRSSTPSIVERSALTVLTCSPPLASSFALALSISGSLAAITIRLPSL